MGQETGKTNTSEEKKRDGDASVHVALITGIVTIVVALLSSPLLTKLLEPKPTPSPTFTASTFPTAIFSPTSPEIALPVDTSTPEIIPANTATPNLPSATATQNSGAIAEMFVRIAASQTTGKAPFAAKFDARGSYVQAPDGTIYECSRGACRYSWYIFLNGQDFAKPDTTGGTLEFRFQQKGTYSISVYICHGSKSPTCGNGATLVIAN